MSGCVVCVVQSGMGQQVSGCVVCVVQSGMGQQELTGCYEAKSSS